MKIRRDVFQAIADPTRREIIKMLAKEPLNLNTDALTEVETWVSYCKQF